MKIILLCPNCSIWETPGVFCNSSIKTKKRRSAPLVASFSSSELLIASGCSLCQDGGEKEAKAVLQLSENEPNFSIVPYTPEKVLALIVSLQKDWSLQTPNIKNFTLHHKIGFDGSTGQSTYKQSSNENNPRNLQQAESLFLTYIVPVELIGFDESQKNVV